MNAAVSFEKRIVAQQALLSLGTFASIAAFVPAVLRPDDAVLGDVVLRTVIVGLVASLVTAFVTSRVVKRIRFTLRSLALGSKAIETSEIEALRRMPTRVGVARWLVETIAIVSIALVRPRAPRRPTPRARARAPPRPRPARTRASSARGPRSPTTTVR